MVLRPEAGMVRFVVRVNAVNETDRSITIERPLPVDAFSSWKPRVWTTGGFRRTLCGVEHLTLALPYSVWLGLGRERGYNLLGFAQVQHSWVNGEGGGLGFVFGGVEA